MHAEISRKSLFNDPDVKQICMHKNELVWIDGIEVGVCVGGGGIYEWNKNLVKFRVGVWMTKWWYLQIELADREGLEKDAIVEMDQSSSKHFFTGYRAS